MPIRLLLTLVLWVGMVSCTQRSNELLGLYWQHNTTVSAAVPDMAGLFISGSTTTPEVREEAESRRARVATYHEALDFVAANSEHLDGLRFIALGSFTVVEDVPYVLSMEVHEDVMRLRLERMDSDWSEGTLFVIARLPRPSETV